MCGIAGYISREKQDNSVIVQAMCDKIRHRGPDAQGIKWLGRATLGHRRLSILDVAHRADQPMGHGESGTWIVFNGEIYNFPDIKKDLEAAGYIFETTGDTEVLLKAYIHWGRACLERLNGMFAFAIWREQEQTLFLARDRLGKKPLFYNLNSASLSFSSELKAFEADPTFKAKVSPQALNLFLSYNYVPVDNCILEGVRKLPPAHWLEYDPTSGSVQTGCYWDLASKFHNKKHYRSEAEACDEFNALFDDAVRIRMISDVPLGGFLSSGLDSASIIERMCQFKSSRDIQTFTIGFNEKGYSEAEGARNTADILAVNHADKIVDASIAETLAQIIANVDEPCGDTSIIPFYFLAEHARQNVTVCLSGDGADELFCGYVTYQADRLHRLLRHIPNGVISGLESLSRNCLPTTHNKVGFDYKIRQFLGGCRLDSPHAHAYWRQIFSHQERQELITPALWQDLQTQDPFAAMAPHFAAVEGCHYLDQASYVDIKTFMLESILVKVDRTTMAHSLEARAPFLDYRLVEFAAALPVKWKLKGLTKKYLLRQAQASRLPQAILNRPKKGFNAPVATWLDGPLCEMAQDLTLHNQRLLQWLNKSAIEQTWADHKNRRQDNGFKLFGLLCFALWLEQSKAN